MGTLLEPHLFKLQAHAALHCKPFFDPGRANWFPQLQLHLMDQESVGSRGVGYWWLHIASKYIITTYPLPFVLLIPCAD